MKRTTSPIHCIAMALTLVLAGAGCSSLGATSENARLAVYRSHAGPPVASFHSFGQFDSWEGLGDEALAVWTHPQEAWLLELYGPCQDLNYSVAIGVTNHMGQVEAGFDKILVSNPAAVSIPCLIRSIRPLDVAAIRQADRDRRAEGERAEPPASGH
ncbi:MAG: hypothetical protein JWL98_1271 [Xanthomonadaceae bacterium]|nr:hypothetical protein [Xanthomonadaceae bacterium]